MLTVHADGLADRPTALALFALRLFNGDLKLAAVVLDDDLGHDECRCKLLLRFFEESELVSACAKRDLSLKRALEGLEFLGIEIDADVNEKTFGRNGVTELSTKNSKVKVYMIPTNEELVIASDTEAIVKASK